MTDTSTLSELNLEIDKKFKQERLNESIFHAWIKDNFKFVDFFTFQINSGLSFCYIVFADHIDISAKNGWTELLKRDFKMNDIIADWSKFKSDLIMMENEANHIMDSIKIVSKDTLHLVDMGLPSGRKWATIDLGASVPSELGTSYFRGEVDAAIQKFNAEHGVSWRLPSAEDYNELIKHTSFITDGTTSYFYNSAHHQCIAFANITPCPTKRHPNQCYDESRFWTASYRVNTPYAFLISLTHKLDTDFRNGPFTYTYRSKKFGCSIRLVTD